MSRNDSRIPAAPLIICFGDSLTAGYQSPTSEYPAIRETPYGVFLQERLGSKVRILVSGLCGELTEEMVRRFRRDVILKQPASVVILGGTNDLGCMVHPEEIMRHLATMYDAAAAADVQPVAVTVPSIRIAGDVGAGDGRAWLDGHIQCRRELNDLILRACRERSLPCVDLFAATQEPDSGWLAQPYSNDGLHLSTEGYRRLAWLLYDEVFSRY
ncbi:MAG: SGNH/GDSL hydrolase family protein [Nitrospiraceae bacterium]